MNFLRAWARECTEFILSRNAYLLDCSQCIRSYSNTRKQVTGYGRYPAQVDLARNVLVLHRPLTGFVEQKFINPRMGLAAHLEGVMNGTYLIALGAVWAEVSWLQR